MAEREINISDCARQILAAVAVYTLVIQAGINMAFSTILLPQIMLVNSTNLTAVDSEASLVVDVNQASWIASLVTITTPIGSLLSGVLMDRFGRKNVCLLTTLPFIVSWCLVALTKTNVDLLYGARSLSGFAAGLSTAALVYVSEVSHKLIRPVLLSLNSVFVSFGILLTILLGYLMPWRMVAICCGLLAILSLILILWLPESAIWLKNSVQKEEKALYLARKSLTWFYFNQEELYAKAYQDLINPESESAPLHPNLPETQSNLFRTYKPVFLLAILFFLQQCSGGYVVIFYASSIFEEIGSIQLDAWTSMMILGIVRFLMSLATAWCSRSVGRRWLMFWSGLGMFISMIIAGFSVLLRVSKIIPVTAVLIFVLASSFGYLVIPWTLIGELCPLSVRGKASGLLTAFAYILMFFTVKLFLYALNGLGLVGIFFIFAAFTLCAMIFVYYCIPETLGKSFEEIQQQF